MKITREKGFQPIVLVLETEEEARALWAVVDNLTAARATPTDVHTLCDDLMDFFLANFAHD